MAGSRGDLPSMQHTGEYLGAILLVMRSVVKLCHAPGGSLEGFPVDWEMALGYALAYAASVMAKGGAESNG